MIRLDVYIYWSSVGLMVGSVGSCVEVQRDVQEVDGLQVDLYSDAQSQVAKHIPDVLRCLVKLPRPQVGVAIKVIPI